MHVCAIYWELFNIVHYLAVNYLTTYHTFLHVLTYKVVPVYLPIKNFPQGGIEWNSTFLFYTPCPFRKCKNCF